MGKLYVCVLVVGKTAYVFVLCFIDKKKKNTPQHIYINPN
jgi:hypothetical protein